MDRRHFLGSTVGIAAGLLTLGGCGGGGGATPGGTPTRASVPPDPNETQHADLVFDGVTLTDKNGVEVTADDLAAMTREHLARKYIYVWDAKWGWHWAYMAYDTGHKYTPAQFNYQPHLNFCVYYGWNDMQADIANKENKRAEYDGHFFVFRRAGTVVCFRYDVSKDTKTPWNCGNKYDTCYSMPNASALSMATAILGIVGISSELAPALVPALVLLPLGL